MPLHDLLAAGRVAIIDGPDDRASVIDAATRLLAGDGVDAAAIGRSLHAREALASTGIGRGVAIPHGRVEPLQHSRGAFLRLARAVDFGAVDGEPVDLVLAIAVPQHSVQQHLQILAELAEQFSDAGFREQLRQAPDTASLCRALLEPDRRLRSA